MKELVITNKGKELIAKLIEGSETINFIKIKTSVHDYSNDDLEKLVDIEDVKQESLVSSIEKTDNTLVEVMAMIDNSDLKSGYYINTIGLYAEDSNKNEILYGVSIAGEYADYIPAFGGKTVSSISYKLITKVDNAEQINIEINPAAIPTIRQFDEIKQVVIESKDLINKHMNSYLTDEEGIHGLKYDESESKLKYKKDGVWNNIGLKNSLDQDQHIDKKICDIGGVHGLEFVEPENILLVQRQNGEKIKFESGINLDDLFKSLTDKINECIDKVGTN